MVDIIGNKALRWNTVLPSMSTLEHDTDKKELLVWGYIKDIEELHRHLNIPIEIKNIIYLYQRICDEWSQKYKSKRSRIIIDRDNAIVTINTRYGISIYGTEVIKEGVFAWRVKIISLATSDSSGAYPSGGIVEDDEAKLNEYLNDNDFDEFGYLLYGGNGILYQAFSSKMNEKEAKKCIWNQPGDILDMELDLDKQTLSCKVRNFLSSVEIL